MKALRLRGQATVELAIGSLLFVTVLAFGIYFTEASIFTLKVQEAGNFALWDSTGRRVHEFAGAAANYGPFGALPAVEAGSATARYQDFVGTGVAKVGNQQSRASASGMTVTCRPNRNIDFTVQTPGGVAVRYPAMLADLNNFYRPFQGGMSCKAEGDVKAVWVKSFLEGGSGFFQSAELKRPTTHVCSSRWCDGELGVLLGTWALEGPPGDNNNAEVPLNTAGPNSTYHQMVKKLFDDNGKGEGSPDSVHAFADTIAQEVVPYREDTFYMSYRGNESGYTEHIVGFRGHMQPDLTTPDFRDYDTNGAPLENCPSGGMLLYTWVAPGRPAMRDRLFLGMPKLSP